MLFTAMAIWVLPNTKKSDKWFLTPQVDSFFIHILRLSEAIAEKNGMISLNTVDSWQSFPLKG